MLTYEQRQANARANEERDRQKERARLAAGASASLQTGVAKSGTATSSSPILTTNNPSTTDINSLPAPVATLNMSAAETNNLYRLIDARVEVRLAALRALPIKQADPYGINAQLDAAQERSDRERFRQEEIKKAFAPLEAGSANKLRPMCDPYGLRAHGLNPDGSPYLGDVDDSNPFQKPASDRLDLDSENPSYRKRR